MVIFLSFLQILKKTLLLVFFFLSISITEWSDSGIKVIPQGNAETHAGNSFQRGARIGNC